MRRAVAATMIGIALFAVRVNAQTHPTIERIDDPPRGAVYWETLGNSMIGCCSGNIDWLVAPHWSVRVGFGLTLLAVIGDFDDRSELFMVNHLTGRHGHYLEAGAGVVSRRGSFNYTSDVMTGPTFTLGYRRQQRDRFFRATFTPVLPPFASTFGEPKGRHFVPAFGVSWGVTFH
jgi:hypothetical protein